MTIILNTTGNPITREERIKINENWTRIISGLTDLQFQINALAGGEDVDDLIKSIKQAIDDALLAISKIETATDNANLATQDAINATNTALTKIAEIEVLIAESTKLNTESAKLNTEAKQNIAQMTTIINTGNQLISDLTALKADIQTAVQQAQEALEQVYGWGRSSSWFSSVTYIKNNVVTHNGSTWQSLVNGNLNNEPSESSPNWILMAKRGSSNKLVAHSEKLTTTSVGQVVWDLPSDYIPVTDTIMLYFNTVYLRPSEYTITGDDATGYKLNYASPETAIVDNNIDALIFKNIPVNDLGQIDGMDLVNGSVTLDKLGQDVKDAIQAGGGGGTVTIDIINDLVTGGATKALSAEQGKVLKGIIDNTNTMLGQVSTKTDKNTTDLGALTTKTDNHIANTGIHVTSAEKTLWNNKRCIAIDNTTTTHNPNTTTLPQFATTHTNVQNANKTGELWYVVQLFNDSTALTGSRIQYAFRQGSESDYKTRSYNGTSWSAWTPSTQELFQSVSNGKTLVASAITGKGVPTASDAAFQTMADNITAIASGGVDIFTKKNFQRTGDARSSFTVTITGVSTSYNVINLECPFRPYSVFMSGKATGGFDDPTNYTFSALLDKDASITGENIAEGKGVISAVSFSGTTVKISFSTPINYIVRKNNSTGLWDMYIPSYNNSLFDNSQVTYDLTVIGSGNTNSKTQIANVSKGDIVKIDGKRWQVLEPTTGMLWYADSFDGSFSHEWDREATKANRTRDWLPSKLTTVANELNTTFLGSLSSEFISAIKGSTWNNGTELDEAGNPRSARVGLLTLSQWQNYKNILDYSRVPLTEPWAYTITKYSQETDSIFVYPRDLINNPDPSYTFDVYQYDVSGGDAKTASPRAVVYVDNKFKVEVEKKIK